MSSKSSISKSTCFQNRPNFGWCRITSIYKIQNFLEVHSPFDKIKPILDTPGLNKKTDMISNSRILQYEVVLLWSIMYSDDAWLILSWDPVKLLMVTISLHSSKDNWSIMTSNQGTSFSSSCTLSKLWHAREPDN